MYTHNYVCTHTYSACTQKKEEGIVLIASKYQTNEVSQNNYWIVFCKQVWPMILWMGKTFKTSQALAQTLEESYNKLEQNELLSPKCIVLQTNSTGLTHFCGNFLIQSKLLLLYNKDSAVTWSASGKEKGDSLIFLKLVGTLIVNLGNPSHG